MSIHSLRKTVADAKRLECLTGTFEFFLRVKSAQLHRAIEISHQPSSDALVKFAIDYIDQTVALIESTQKRVRQLGLKEAIAPALQTALAFFRAPPLPSREFVPGDEPKLYQLMEQAYLAQRLLEEVSDLCLLWRNSRLSHLENTHDSLIIHQLIGESRANQLDTIAYRLAQEQLPVIRQTASTERALHTDESPADQELYSPPRLNHHVRLTIGPPDYHPAIKCSPDQ